MVGGASSKSTVVNIFVYSYSPRRRILEINSLIGFNLGLILFFINFVFSRIVLIEI